MTFSHTGRWMLVVVSLLACGVGCGDGASAPPPLEASGFFESDGLQIHYESFGEGERYLILVHGWGVSLRSNWIEPGWIDELRSIRRVIAIDVRGHGDSDKPVRQELYGYGVMARDVLNLMDHFGIADADLMGYSMGSFMAVHLLGHHRERLRSVILGGIGDETEASAAQALVIADALRAESISDVTNPVGRIWRALVEADPRNDLAALAVSALEMWPQGFPLDLGGGGLAEVDIPVLIVNGALDFPYVDTDQTLAAAIPGAELVTIPGRDHVGTVYDPLFRQEALQFLTRQDEARFDDGGDEDAPRLSVPDLCSGLHADSAPAIIAAVPRKSGNTDWTGTRERDEPIEPLTPETFARRLDALSASVNALRRLEAAFVEQNPRYARRLPKAPRRSG